MSNEFNSYHKWLGIPLKDQPTDYYWLLGVTQFENDLDVITGASDQRMHFLRTLQTGERGKLVDKLLNKIANAKVCLLNKEKKAAYDQKLRGKTASPKQTTQKALFQADAEPVSRRRVGNSKSARRNSKEENKPNRRPIGLIIGGGIIAVLILVGTVLFISGRAQNRKQERQAEISKKEAAAIHFFSKKNARYTQQADVQYKKKAKANKNGGKENTNANSKPPERTRGSTGGQHAG